MSTSAKRIAMLAVAAMFVAGVTAEADTTWNTDVGHWRVDSNWTNGEPSGAEKAFINRSDADVTLDDSEGVDFLSMQRWSVDEGELTIDYSDTLRASFAQVLSSGGKDSTVNIKNGTLTAKEWTFGRNTDSTVTVNMYGGTLDDTYDSPAGGLIIGDDNGNGEGYGTLNLYGGNVSLELGHLHIKNGTFKAWLGDDFNPASVNDKLLVWGGSEATLDVGLPGGVMQSSTNSFNLIEYESDRENDFDNTPDHLWTHDFSTDHKSGEAGELSVSLDSANYQRGTLDPSNIGDTTPLGSSIYGFIEWDNQENATATEILLDFAWDGSGSESDTWDRFIADLGDEGYTVLDQNFDERNPWAQLELDLDGEETEYFTWDLSEYTGSAQLQVNGMEVVPEPSSLLLLGLASLLLMKRRGRA